MSMSMHHSYIDPETVDGAVMHKQAAARLRDKRDPQETKVHAHKHGQKCNDRCIQYNFSDLEQGAGEDY